MFDSVDRDLAARRTQHMRPVFPTWRWQHMGGPVELVVEVPPFPVAVFRRRCFEGEAGASAVLKLQGGGCGGDVRAVALPAFRPFFVLSLFTLLGFQFEGAFRPKVAPGDEGERRQENSADAGQRRGDQRIAATPARHLSQRADPASPYRLAGQEAAQVLAQVECAGVALARLLLQAMEANRDQIARNP